MTAVAPTEWKPTLVLPPEKDPEGRTFYDWNDDRIRKWKSDAIKFQEAHVRDNSRTEWFTYKPEERDAIELRILLTVNGVRTPKEGTKATPVCPLKTYTRSERLHARKIRKVIVKNASSSDLIHFNVIYISAATLPKDGKEFLASEEPLFVVKKCRRFIDKVGKLFKDFSDWLENNALPQGPMIYPRDGNYTPPPNDKDGKVPLDAAETPSTTPLARIKAVTDSVVMVAGIALAVTGVVTFAAPTLFSAQALAVIQGASFLLSAYSAIGAGYNIYEKTSRDESIRTEVLLLASSFFSMYAAGVNRYWRMELGKYAREGKTFGEIADKITKAQKRIFVAVKLITFASSASGLLSSLWDLVQKKERTWLDYYQFCMSLFTFANVLTTPWTIKGVFESEQMQCLKEIRDKLGNDEAKKGANETIKANKTSDQKAYLIRHLRQVENPTEFFELVHKTKSVVTCTADGFVVNDKIDIHPQAYNEIGKAVFGDKIIQIMRYQQTAQNISLVKEFEQYVPRDQSDTFKERVEEIAQLPPEQRKQAMKDLITDLGGAVTDQDFNNGWDRAGVKSQELVEKDLNKLINNLQEGSVRDEQKADFDRLKELSKKQIDGTITQAEQTELQEKVVQCSKHRKEHFFQSSSDHRTDANYAESMDKAEKSMAGGKNLEEWKAEKQQLESAHQNQQINDAEYQRQKADIDKGIANAQQAREFRKEADKFVYDKKPNDNESNALRRRYVQKYERALSDAQRTNDQAAITKATDDLKAANELVDVLNKTQSFTDKIRTFTNGQNERLCYRIDVDKVKADLQHIFGRPDWESMEIGGRQIFQDMKLPAYDRISRVLRDYKSNGEGLMKAAACVANDPRFAGQVNTPNDMASITEAISIKAEKLNSTERKAYIASVASGDGQNYEAFLKEFNDRINQVNNLDPAIRSQWTAPLSMAYHWWKHENDFRQGGRATIAEYFETHAENLFRTENLTRPTFTQTGVPREIYMRSFGHRVHVGYTIGPNHTKTSHFGKDNTR